MITTAMTLFFSPLKSDPSIRLPKENRNDNTIQDLMSFQTQTPLSSSLTDGITIRIVVQHLTGISCPLMQEPSRARAHARPTSGPSQYVPNEFKLPSLIFRRLIQCLDANLGHICCIMHWALFFFQSCINDAGR